VVVKEEFNVYEEISNDKNEPGYATVASNGNDPASLPKEPPAHTRPEVGKHSGEKTDVTVCDTDVTNEGISSRICPVAEEEKSISTRGHNVYAQVNKKKHGTGLTGSAQTAMGLTGSAQTAVRPMFAVDADVTGQQSQPKKGDAYTQVNKMKRKPGSQADQDPFSIAKDSKKINNDAVVAGQSEIPTVSLERDYAVILQACQGAPVADISCDAGDAGSSIPAAHDHTATEMVKSQSSAEMIAEDLQEYDEVSDKKWSAGSTQKAAGAGAGFGEEHLENSAPESYDTYDHISLASLKKKGKLMIQH
jgi:hypothetical protein